MPPHIGSSTPGLGYEDGDPYADFLPPPLVTDEDGHAEFMQAVVIITGETEKGTARHLQEYSNPLLTLDGKQYASMTFNELHDRICDALRRDRPRLVIETIGPDGRMDHRRHAQIGVISLSDRYAVLESCPHAVATAVHFPKEGVAMKIHWMAGLLVAIVFSGGTAQAEGLFDKMLDRAVDSAERKAQNRMNQRIDQSIDKAINKTEEAVQCVATDQECLKRAKDQGKPVSIVNQPTLSDSTKCIVTDATCLKQAKAKGKKVEIVEEADLDTLRCSVTDAECLKRAKAMGKKVEITD